MNLARRAIGGVAAFVALSGATASSARSQQAPALPPVRQLGAPLAVSKDSIGKVSGIRELSDGRVLINDPGKRRLLLYDAALTHAVVVADSTPSTNKAYGKAGGGIIPYLGDTTIFVDATAIAFLVLDPNGKIVRVIAPPSDPRAMYGSFDARGRLVYLPVTAQQPAQSAPTLGESLVYPDSVMIVRADMSSRAIDTAGAIVVGQMTRSWTIPGRADAPPTQMIGYDPLVLFDWAAVTSDGSIAMVRGLDYHIDWVNPDGSRGSTPRMAHDWGTRLSDSAKQAIIDSVHQLRDSIIAENLRRDSLSRANGRKPAPGTVVRVPPKYVFVYVGPSELPDYQPPFLPGEVYADADNELWIREGTNPTLDPPPIYDIVSRQGVVIDRVQAPPGLTLAGFGHDAVYFTSNEPYGTAVLTYRIR